MNSFFKIILVSSIAGAIVGSGMTLFVGFIQKNTKQDFIREFYEVENAVHVSPHSLRQKMSKGQTDGFVLVDLRSKKEYENEHIATAVNIPAYSDPNTSAYQDVDRIVQQFRDLIKSNPQKDIIVYCYSTPCMTGRKIGQMLVEHGIYVQHLGIGWSEWRYFWSLWNHDAETSTKVEDYIAQGKEPGVPKVNKLPSPCGEGEFSC